MKPTLKFSYRKWLLALALMGAVNSLPLSKVHAVEPKDINPKAMEDMKVFFDKAEEGNKGRPNKGKTPYTSESEQGEC